jgi:hypothetical protein
VDRPVVVIVSAGTFAADLIVRGVGAVADQMAAVGVEAEEVIVVNQDYSDRRYIRTF